MCYNDFVNGGSSMPWVKNPGHGYLCYLHNKIVTSSKVFVDSYDVIWVRIAYNRKSTTGDPKECREVEFLFFIFYLLAVVQNDIVLSNALLQAFLLHVVFGRFFIAAIGNCGMTHYFFAHGQ